LSDNIAKARAVIPAKAGIQRIEKVRLSDNIAKARAVIPA
jgi:hypothetical protein